MPNHCENDLWVHGSLKEQERFIAFAESNLCNGKPSKNISELNFETILPYPQKYLEIDNEYNKNQAMLKDMTEAQRTDWIKIYGYPKDGYNSGGYDWCVHTWGTKWNAYEIVRKIRTRSVFYTFQTAWSPPSPVILAFSKAFPELLFTLKYYEQGVGYKGREIYQAGECLVLEGSSYKGSRGG